MKPILAPLSAVALCICLPASAQPASIGQLEQQIDEVTTWMGRATAAQESSNRALAGFSTGIETIDGMLKDPRRNKEAAARIRDLAAAAEESVRKSDALLAAIPPLSPQVVQRAGYDLNRIIPEARAQNQRVLEILRWATGFADALDSGDSARIQAAVPGLFKTSLLLLDNQRLILRNRQLAVPATDSLHQSIGLFSLFYRVMGAATRAWIVARVDGTPEKGESFLRGELKEAAAELAILLPAGRANLARELKMADSLRPRLDARRRTLIDRAAAVRAQLEGSFRAGDELRRIVDSSAGITGRELAGEEPPALLGELTSLERRFVQVGTDIAAAMRPPEQ